MNSSQELKELLLRIDHRGYPAYKDTRGRYQFRGYNLSIDHVQGDPFAAPSKVSIRIPGSQAGFPKHLYEASHTRTALCDCLLRTFAKQIERFTFKARGSGKSGLIGVSRCGQEILSRSACTIDAGSGEVTLRLEVGFPANGRTINSGELIKIFFDYLPVCVEKSLYYQAYLPRTLEDVCTLAQNQQAIRQQLPEHGLCAFIANGAILPRESGISQKPMKHATAFVSPASLEVSLPLPDGSSITGMGIPRGVTLIVGGGYHGKSTLLEALERGVYNHIAGDGREYVITDDTAVKIRAEDGRCVHRADISMFINDLPNKKDTRHFDTLDASGSTSQAANVVEALEAGTSLLLIDEDTCASNFMVRDALMESVVSRSSEPITPLIHRIRQMYEEWGISTILVAGSSGAFFEKADVILQMDHYIPLEITQFAKQAADAAASAGFAKSTSAPEDTGSSKGAAAEKAAAPTGASHPKGAAAKEAAAPTGAGYPKGTAAAAGPAGLAPAAMPDFTRRPFPAGKAVSQASTAGNARRTSDRYGFPDSPASSGSAGSTREHSYGSGSGPAGSRREHGYGSGPSGTRRAQGHGYDYDYDYDSDSNSDSGSFGSTREHGRSLDQNDRVKIKVNGRDSVSINKETIDLRYVEQLVDSEQLMTLGYMLAYAQKHFANGQRTLQEIVDLLQQTVREKGLAAICESSWLPSGLAMPRQQEICACFNRCRNLFDFR